MTALKLETRVLTGRSANDRVVAKNPSVATRLVGEQTPAILFPFAVLYPQPQGDANRQRDAEMSAVVRSAGRPMGCSGTSRLCRHATWPSIGKRSAGS
jgi:hypothetical protein